MKLVADLHIHSHFSRATSGNLTFEHLARWAQLKGIHVVGTGDIAHPGWLAEMRDKLVPAEDGLYRLRDDLAAAVQAQTPPACHAPVRFILGGEISNIYKRDGKTRKVHNVVFAPSFDAVERLQARLERIGNIRADGRPILGLDSRDLLEIVLDTDPDCHLIPAHIWTPWFSLLGSKSGFDSVEACYADLTPHIFALETGLSSDPPMNWRLSALDRYTLVSNSDAHSPEKLGREANLFDCDLAYGALFDALLPSPVRGGGAGGGGGTLEFFPEEGKYHFDGHRACNIAWDPQATRAHGGLCPVCGKPVTVGVMHRVEELADRPVGGRPPRAAPFHSLVPLPEVLGEVYGVGEGSKQVQAEYANLLARLGPELAILRDMPLEEIAAAGGERLAEGIGRMRRGEVVAQPGYDGEYGVIRVFAGAARVSETQMGLFEEEDEGRKTKDERLGSGGAEEWRSRGGDKQGSGGELREGQAGGDQTPDLLAVAEPQAPYPPAGDTHHASRSTHHAPFLADLNPEQRAAVLCTDRPLVIVAGPGTGKTRTLTVRIAHLILERGVAPESVLAITFTNKAASEMGERLTDLLGADVAGRVIVKTFHAFGAMLLRQYAERLGLSPEFVILNEEDRAAVLKQACPELRAAEVDAALAEISAGKAGSPPVRRLKSASDTESRLKPTDAPGESGEPAQVGRLKSASDTEGRLKPTDAPGESGKPAQVGRLKSASDTESRLKPTDAPGELGEPGQVGRLKSAPDMESRLKPTDAPGGPSLQPASAGLAYQTAVSTAVLCRRYDAALRASDAVDFDDLILLPIRLLEEHPDVLAALRARYRWISVDEYQDVNAAQYRLLRLMTSDHPSGASTLSGAERSRSALAERPIEWTCTHPSAESGVPTPDAAQDAQTAGRVNLCVIGDPDQAIYGFRGADRRYFLQFEQDYPGAAALSLSRNYRSSQRILDAAMQVIARNPDRKSAEILAEFADEVKLDVYRAPSDKAEAEYVVHQIEQMVGGTSYFSLDSGRTDGASPAAAHSFADFAVLYRLSAQSRLLIEAFDRSGIPYQTAGQASLYAHKAVREVLAQLWRLYNPRAPLFGAPVIAGQMQMAALRSGIEASAGLSGSRVQPAEASAPGTYELSDPAGRPVARLIEQVAAQIVGRRAKPYDDADAQRIHQLALRAVPFGDRLADFLESTALQSETDAYDPRADRVALMSLHASKGLEFPVVFIVGCEEGLLPYARQGETPDIEEERRLFYVGLTRASRKLVLTHARKRVLFGQFMENATSRFVGDIEAALKEAKVMQYRPPERKPDSGQMSLF